MNPQTRSRLHLVVTQLSIGGLTLVAAVLVFLVIWGATHGAQLD